MSASGPNPLPALGFLTVIDQPEVGLVGGYLVLNAAGRPLEFHCTAPVRANRTQQILYGATLAPYLYGEQIGATLLGKAKVQPLAVCTNVQAVLCVRALVGMPVVLVHDQPANETPSQTEPEGTLARIDPPHTRQISPHSARLVEFSLAGHRLAALASYEGDCQRMAEAWQPHADAFDLCEPFCRIREALAEAQRGAT